MDSPGAKGGLPDSTGVDSPICIPQRASERTPIVHPIEGNIIMPILDELKKSRRSTWLEAQHILDTAEKHKRNLSSGEQDRYNALESELAEFDQRIAEVSDLEQRNAVADVVRNQFEQRAHAATGRPGGAVTDDSKTIDAFRSMILEKNPRPIDLLDSSPRSYYQPGVERRDLLKTAPTNYQPVSFYKQIIEHAVDASAVLRAGATIVTTPTGEDLRVPRSTALSTASIIAEGAAITESDPTLSTVTLGAYKYAILVQVSSEMAADAGVNLQEYLARECGQAIGLALGNHLINGTGTGQPTGVLASATLGVAGPTGTATSLGSQGTAGQGTDLLNELVGSLAEPYAASPSAAFLLRNSALTKVKNLKTTTGELVGNQYVSGSTHPFHADAYVPAMAANAKSILFGDWSRYFVRMVNGIRFERSDDYAFANDMVTFRAILRADGALINTDAIKYFANSAT